MPYDCPSPFRFRAPRAARTIAASLLFAAAAGALCAAFALAHMQVETVMVRGAKVTVRASSCLQGPRVFSLANLFDNDSTTCWIEGEADSLAGRWFDISFQEQKRFRGIIFGLGCRADYQSLAEFGIPTGVRVKLDEKDAVDRSVGWEWGNDGLVYSGVNMRQCVLWFDSDTAYTTAQIRVKFTSVTSGRRYLNVAVSDVEPIDAFDSRFELLPILVSRSFNPNDLGAVYAPVFPQTAQEQQWIARVVDSVAKSTRAQNAGDLASALSAALNVPVAATTDNDSILKYVAALHTMLVSGPVLPRFVFDGRKASYLLPVGSMRMGRMRLDVWRTISSQRTSKGLEITLGYAAFVS
jgi:hypothetical protein